MAKNNTVKWVGIIITALVLFATTVGGYFVTQDDLVENTEDIAVIRKDVDANTIAVAEVKKDIEHIKEDLTEIKDSQREQMTIQQVILREVRK